MASVRSIHHIAVVVSDMSASLAFWRDALGMELSGLKDVIAEQSQVAFLPTTSTELELVLPTTKDSGIAKNLKRYHMQHHYKAPNTRYGVSSPLWDFVFGTQGAA